MDDLEAAQLEAERIARGLKRPGEGRSLQKSQNWSRRGTDISLYMTGYID